MYLYKGIKSTTKKNKVLLNDNIPLQVRIKGACK